VLLVIVLELLALDGRAMHYLGLSLRGFQSGGVSDPLLLDTVAAMTVNGVIFYLAGSTLEWRGSEQARIAAPLLFAIAPFALLHPLGYLVRSHEYAARLDWIYAGCAATIILLSHRRQRRSFYYAGLINLGAALYLIASHRQWFGRPAWAISLIAAGLAVLLAGFALDRRERQRR
jgi:hypothetical protein